MDDSKGYVLRTVEDDEWEIVRWLWQAYRGDLAAIVQGLPYADGRYQSQEVDPLPDPNVVGYLAWRSHPNTGEDAPIAFALVDGVQRATRSIRAFWVAPAARRGRIGSQLAQAIIERHPGTWTIAFQQENRSAGVFWRQVADRAFGAAGWIEEELPVPGLPYAPPDHRIRNKRAGH